MIVAVVLFHSAVVAIAFVPVSVADGDVVMVVAVRVNHMLVVDHKFDVYHLVNVLMVACCHYYCWGSITN